MGFPTGTENRYIRELDPTHQSSSQWKEKEIEVDLLSSQWKVEEVETRRPSSIHTASTKNKKIEKERPLETEKKELKFDLSRDLVKKRWRVVREKFCGN